MFSNACGHFLLAISNEVDKSTCISLSSFSKSLVLAVCNLWLIVLDVSVLFYFVVSVDEENSKDVLD